MFGGGKNPTEKEQKNECETKGNYILKRSSLSVTNRFTEGGSCQQL